MCSQPSISLMAKGFVTEQSPGKVFRALIDSKLLVNWFVCREATRILEGKAPENILTRAYTQRVHST